MERRDGDGEDLPGASIPPEAMMHFPPFSDFPLIFLKIFLTFWKISKMLHFPEKISHFHQPKFLTTFSSTTNFGFPPIFPVLIHFPSDSRKFVISPNFSKFPPVFKKLNSFLHTLRVISPLLLP